MSQTQLQTRLRFVKCRINRLVALAAQMEAGTAKRDLFRSHCCDLAQLKAEFEECHLQLAVQAADTESVAESEESERELEEFDTAYYKVHEVYMRTAVKEVSVATSGGDSSAAGRANNVKLPKLLLPTFSGVLTEWASFHDLFTSLVHNSPSLSAVEKQQYLLTSLSGEPHNLIRTLPLSAGNYDVAWKTLVKRYQNIRVIATVHLDNIIHFPKLVSSSPDKLRTMIDVLKENVGALSVLKFPVQEWSFILLNIVLPKVDQETRNQFEIAHKGVEIPTFDQLIEFLESQCKALMLANSSLLSSTKPLSKRTTQVATPHFKGAFLVTSKVTECVVCHATHTIFRCPVFLELSVEDRRNLVKTRNLCYNCLGDHQVKECVSKRRCMHCHKTHHSLLHSTIAAPRETEGNGSITLSGEGSQSELPVEIEKPVGVVSLTSSHDLTTVVLGTAIVRVVDASGALQKVRALVDSGSQSSFISEGCVQRLRLPRRKATVPVVGLAHSVVDVNKGTIRCVLAPSQGPHIITEALILESIASELPSVPLPSGVRQQYRGLDLADPTFDTPGPIDLLLGADIYPDIIDGGRYKPIPGFPAAFSSVFGWVLMGKVNSQPSSPVISLFTAAESSLAAAIKQFWEIEEAPTKHVDPKDVECETHFAQTHQRSPDGRYIVRLPFNGSRPILGDSRLAAERRLCQLERRLSRDPQLYQEYCNFMKDYEVLGHMHPVNSLTDHEVRYYIPHHCVRKESSSTTKLRVVFDASAPTTSGHSLNDMLMPGPKLQNDITQVITRFRLHTVVLTADICKMYRQVLLHPEDKCYQVILWREDPSQPIQEYELDTVTYGVSSSPFLAMRTLQQLAIDEQEAHPEAARVVLDDVFVDDIVSGAPSVAEACVLQHDLVELLKKGGFELRKWSSNCKEVLESIPEAHRETPLTFHDKQTGFKVLGLEWDPTADVFCYHLCSLSTVITKRSILSDIARIYDPLGWIGPVVFRAKRFLQNLWLLGLAWDESPPHEVIREWQQFVTQLPLLSCVKIPRQVSTDQGRCELHGFSDASSHGYAAVVYLRGSVGKETVTHLMFAKSKVAPLKTVTLPRLELLGAHLLMKLLEAVKSMLAERLIVERIVGWCDSTVVLAWIKTAPHCLKTFVANRVSQIQESLATIHWRYVPSRDNPADCLSRGVAPQELIDHTLWWQGPLWLQSEEREWPNQDHSAPAQQIEGELKGPRVAGLLSQTQQLYLLECIQNYSSWSKTLRVIAMCLRFIMNLRHPGERSSSPLTTLELETARQVVIKQVQQEAFGSEIANLAKGKECSPTFKKLNIFLDTTGVVRVGGRLQNSNLRYGEKHPILLPKGNHITDMIIDYYHVTTLHAGVNLTQAAIYQEFWILSGKSAVKSRIFKCVKCFRFKASEVQPMMGNLPAGRVQPSRPFSQVGVDYGGPFLVKSSRLRNARTCKAYLCVFVCFATKAVHLEVVSSLSTPAFLSAFYRFTSRRGLCKDVYSDCGTQFVGANREVSELQEHLQISSNAQEVANNLSTHGIQWHFNPPAAPHFGGLWEAGVKSAKSHLKRVIGTQALTFEELSTVFAQIEAVLNSRPLCALSSDPNDLGALTPAHFLIGTTLISPPMADLTELPMSRLDRWQLVQQTGQHFWKRWYQEYLHTLQPRGKWRSTRGTLQVGDLVLLKEDNLPPLRWQLGRVSALHPGRDGVSRVATIKLQHGKVKRPVVKVCPLPMQ